MCAPELTSMTAFIPACVCSASPVTAGQQRNVSLYIMHLILDTAVLVCVFQPMIELWLGLTETTADVRAGVWGFTYLVACYALELTWRLSVDTMLAVHHIGTITIILLYAGELTVSWLRELSNLSNICTLLQGVLWA